VRQFSELTGKELQGRKRKVSCTTFGPVLLVEGARSALDVFDEFGQQQEFKLALHAVCDFILDSNSRQVSESIINEILHLHTAMEIDDACVQELQSHQSA
jgi:hypothetical protein